MCTRSELNILLKKVSEVYKSVYGETLVRVILYGSYARGDFSEDSDVDIVALVRGNREKLQEQLKIVWDQTYDIGLDYDVVLSPAVIPYEEFERYQEHFNRGGKYSCLTKEKNCCHIGWVRQRKNWILQSCFWSMAIIRTPLDAHIMQCSHRFVQY